MTHAKVNINPPVKLMLLTPKLIGLAALSGLASYADWCTADSL